MINDAHRITKTHLQTKKADVSMGSTEILEIKAWLGKREIGFSPFLTSTTTKLQP